MEATASSGSCTVKEITPDPNRNKQNSTDNPTQNPSPKSNSESQESQDWIPKLNMEFESEQAAYDFYNRYAFRTGFGIRWSWKHTLKNSNEAKDRTFCCSRQGFRKKSNNNNYNNNNDNNNNNNQGNIINNNMVLETRCNCFARMKVVLNNGVYRVYEFISDHNHPLVKSEYQIKRLRSHRFIKKDQNEKNERISRVLDVKRTSKEGWDPVRGYKELCAMFIQVAELAAQSEASFDFAVDCKNRLVEDLGILLKNNRGGNVNKRLLIGESSGEKKLKPDILAELDGSSEGQWQLSDSSNASETEHKQI